MAHALTTTFDLRKGDRVLIQSANCSQMVEAIFAVFRIGAVLVPTNFRLTPDEVAYMAQSSGARAMICQAAFPAHAARARELSPALEHVIAIGPAEFGPDLDSIVTANLGARVDAAPVDRDDPCWFFYTSGTTGHPKAAVLTHGQLTFVILNHIADLFPATSHKDRSIVVAPLSHGAGIHALAQVARGATTILMPGDKLEPEVFWRTVQVWKITNLFAVPTIIKLLVEDACGRPVSTIPLCATSSMRARRCTARTRSARWISWAAFWCSIMGWPR